MTVFRFASTRVIAVLLFVSVALGVGYFATSTPAGASGTDWTVSTSYPAPFHPSSVVCPSASVCEAVGGPGIMGTTDGGSTWNPQLPPQGITQLSGLVCRVHNDV